MIVSEKLASTQSLFCVVLALFATALLWVLDCAAREILLNQSETR